MTDSPLVVGLPGGGAAVAGAALAELVAALRAHRDACAGRVAPMGVALPRWTGRLGEVLAELEAATVAEQRRRVSAAGPDRVGPPAATVARCGCAGRAAPGGQGISTAEAAGRLDVTRRTIRRWLDEGLLVGDLGPRNVWSVDVASVAELAKARAVH